MSCCVSNLDNRAYSAYHQVFSPYIRNQATKQHISGVSFVFGVQYIFITRLRSSLHRQHSRPHRGSDNARTRGCESRTLIRPSLHIWRRQRARTLASTLPPLIHLSFRGPIPYSMSAQHHDRCSNLKNTPSKNFSPM